MGRTSDARERLLEAAWELICAETYGAVGVEAICGRAEVKKGSFYHFFESKADLAIQAMEEHWRDYRAQLLALFAPEIPPLERLFRHFDAVIRFHRDRAARGACICGCPFLHLGSEMVREDPRILRTARRILEEYFALFRDTLRDARRCGDLEAGDPDALARQVAAFLEGILSLARLHDDPGVLEDLIPGIRRLLGLPA